MKNKLKLLKSKSFLCYLLADLFNGFGSSIIFVGMNWFILDKTGMNRNVGLIMTFFIVSGLCTSPFAGTIVDRFNRKKIVIWINSIRILIAVLFIVLYTNQMIDHTFIYILSVVGGIGWAVYMPATRGLIQELFEEEGFIQGNSLLEISLQIGTFVAAGISGFVYEYFGMSFLLMIHVAVLFISTCLFLALRYEKQISASRGESFWVQLHEGMIFSKNRKTILLGLALFIPFVVTISSNAVLPGYVHDHLKESSAVFGLADMFYGIGAFLAGIAVLGMLEHFTKQRLITFFFLLSVFSLFALSLNKFVIGLFIGYTIFGLSNSSLRILMNTIAMEVIDKRIFGRVMATWMAISSLLQIILVYSLGILVDIYPENIGFIILSVCMACGMICIFRYKIMQSETTQLTVKN